jgi:hypothetical protein
MLFKLQTLQFGFLPWAADFAGKLGGSHILDLSTFELHRYTSFELCTLNVLNLYKSFGGKSKATTFL